MNTHDIDTGLPYVAFCRVSDIDPHESHHRQLGVSADTRLYTEDQVLAAIEADRKRRGEPTAAEISDVVREITGCPDIKSGEKSMVVALAMLFHSYAAPQHTEPVKPAVNMIAAEAATLLLNKLGYLWSGREWVLAEPVNGEELLAAREALIDMGYLWDGDQWVEVDPPSKTAEQAPEWPDFARMEASLQRLKERLVFENGRRKDLEQRLREKRNG